MGAWDNYWDAVWSPEWAADLTQSLLATALGLGGAYLVLVRQFRHERALAVEQAQAEVRVRATDETGVLFIRAAGSLKADSPPAPRELWTSHEASGVRNEPENRRTEHQNGRFVHKVETHFTFRARWATARE
ncbi:hypothetical protein GCM10022197_17690 [Microlunatus spumicola]|uniref:Uncharacterized protein n=1 Tax=Microlunatus spumicola TaxID=81499 RepID=A0ABP6X721_9ACTN